MLKMAIGFGLLGICLMGLEDYRSMQLQGRRTGEQALLLTGLESLRSPSVSQLIVDWRLTYPEPNEDRLAELRDLAVQLKANPDALDKPRASHTGAIAAQGCGSATTREELGCTGRLLCEHDRLAAAR